jgi:alpha-glucosidase
MDLYEQGRLQFSDMLMADTAERELLINFHGSVVPTGLRRRWPHVLTYEGVLGAEHLKFGTITPDHNVTLPFTRNVVGPMDYTPVTFSAETRHTTVGHELALSVVYESGLQHFADSIDSYAEQPIAERFLERVPAAWDETRLLRGYPGSEATFARRRDDEWFIGCLTAGAPRTVTLPLDFLDDDFDVTLVKDDETGEELIRETVVCESPIELSIDVPANGGFILHCK